MKTVLKTKNRDEIIDFMVNILHSEYTKYLSLFECKSNEMNKFIKYSIKEVLCDTSCHFGHGFVKNIGNVLAEGYNFYFNLKTETYIIELNSLNDDMIPLIDDNIVNWELWDDYEVCLKEAVNKFLMQELTSKEHIGEKKI